MHLQTAPLARVDDMPGVVSVAIRMWLDVVLEEAELVHIIGHLLVARKQEHDVAVGNHLAEDAFLKGLQ